MTKKTYPNLAIPGENDEEKQALRAVLQTIAEDLEHPLLELELLDYTKDIKFDRDFGGRVPVPSGRRMEVTIEYEVNF